MVTKNTYRRLGYGAGDHSFELTIPNKVVTDSEWTKGMCLYFRSFEGIFKFSSIEDPLAKKIKLQQTNVFYVHVPARIIEHMGFKKGQQFMFSSGPGYIKYNPYIEFSSNKLIGVAKKKEVPNNSGKYLEHKAEGLSINEDLQQMQN